jgi:hypothetical protein
MTTKKILLALAATSLLALGPVTPVYADDTSAQADDGSSMDAPADPDSADSGDTTPDPGTDAGDAGDTGDSGDASDSGDSQPE